MLSVVHLLFEGVETETAPAAVVAAPHVEDTEVQADKEARLGMHLDAKGPVVAVVEAQMGAQVEAEALVQVEIDAREQPEAEKEAGCLLWLFG